jgi:predicted transcriptional regulator
MTKVEQVSINEAFPHIFKRPLLAVHPSDSLMTVGTFLAIGPQIYVDGLVVIESDRPVGRIGGQHIIQYILDKLDDLPKATASDIMLQPASAIPASSPIGTALDIFAETYFAFVPVTIDNKAVATLSIRDVLKLAASSDLEIPVHQLSSPLFSVKNDVSIGDILETMMDRGVRNVITKDEKDVMRVINDRKVLEFLMSHEGRQMLNRKSLKRIYDVRVDILDMPVAKQIRPTMPASLAAELLSDINTPCLLTSEESITTPWDIVIKGFRGSR